jgi:hypothetical protein
VWPASAVSSCEGLEGGEFGRGEGEVAERDGGAVVEGLVCGGTRHAAVAQRAVGSAEQQRRGERAGFGASRAVQAWVRAVRARSSLEDAEESDLRRASSRRFISAATWRGEMMGGGESRRGETRRDEKRVGKCGARPVR